MRKYEFKDLYVASIIKIAKDFYNKENKIPDCIETVGFAIVTKSHFFDNTFVDVFTKESYNALLKTSQVGEYVYTDVQPFEIMCSSLSKEEAQLIRDSEWNIYTLADMLETINEKFPEFVESRLNPKEDDDIDTSKMC